MACSSSSRSSVSISNLSLMYVFNRAAAGIILSLHNKELHGLNPDLRRLICRLLQHGRTIAQVASFPTAMSIYADPTTFILYSLSGGELIRVNGIESKLLKDTDLLKCYQCDLTTSNYQGRVPVGPKHTTELFEYPIEYSSTRSQW